jgi:hypothetical protein
MKYLILGTALALAVPLTSGIGVANAQDVRISVGDRAIGVERVGVVTCEALTPTTGGFE